ncbi:MAG: hypothetical protein ACRES4_05515, partial [Nevskiales bacterium]
MARYWPLLLATLLIAPGANAGDLERLPDTEAGFRQKIEAFIKPGNRVEDSLKILEAHRFECREFNNKYPVIHCSRMDEPASGSATRLYQVLI